MNTLSYIYILLLFSVIALSLCSCDNDGSNDNNNLTLLTSGGAWNLLSATVDEVDKTEVVGLRKYLLIGERWKDLRVPVTRLWGDKDIWAKSDLAKEIQAKTSFFKLWW
jgi:hypothetical protein